MELRERGQEANRTGDAAGSTGQLRGASDERIASQLDGLDQFLRGRFRWLSSEDREDLCQDAYLRLLAYEDRGNEVRNVAALLRTIAARAAISRYRSTCEFATDPDDHLFETTSLDADPQRSLEFRLDFAWLAEALDGLNEAERAAYQARWVAELDGEQACRELGVSRASYYRHLQRATSKVAAVMASEKRLSPAHGVLLRSYLNGTASPSERRRIERLILSDPLVAAEAREQAAMHRSAAALLPPVVLVGEGLGGSGALAAAAGWLVDKLPFIGGSSSSVGGGAGALGALGGSKLLAGGICAGTAALCAAGGIIAIERSDGGDRDRPAPVRSDVRERALPRGPLRLIDPIPPPTLTAPQGEQSRDGSAENLTGKPTNKDRARGNGVGRPESPPSPQVTSPEPAAEEFDPLATAPPEPVAAPAPALAAPTPSAQNSSGSSSGATTQSEVAGSEFGP